MFTECKIRDGFKIRPGPQPARWSTHLAFPCSGEEWAGYRLWMSSPSEPCWGAKGLVADGSPALIGQRPSSHHHGWLPWLWQQLFHRARVKDIKLAIKMCPPRCGQGEWGECTCLPEGSCWGRWVEYESERPPA